MKLDPEITDEQLLEEYTKEIHGVYYSPEDKMTVARLIKSHRSLREWNIKFNGEYSKGQKEGFEYGYNFGVRSAASDTIQYKDLRKMTIQDLANLIGTDDD